FVVSFFFSSRRRHTRWPRDWSSDVCSSDLPNGTRAWVPTFPRARYLMGRVEFTHWREQHARDDMAAVFADSVKPVYDAGLVDLRSEERRVGKECRCRW